MTPWVLRLVIANVVMFALQQLLPQFANYLVFIPRLAYREPWTAVTYMFLHGNFMHILFNMLGLFWFGPRVEERLGGPRFLQLYFIAGVTGALFQLLLAPGGAMVGASAGARARRAATTARCSTRAPSSSRCGAASSSTVASSPGRTCRGRPRRAARVRRG